MIRLKSFVGKNNFVLDWREMPLTMRFKFSVSIIFRGFGELECIGYERKAVRVSENFFMGRRA